MRIYLLAIGRRAPAWVEQGYRQYAERMPPSLRLELIEVAETARAGTVTPAQAMHKEAQRISAAIPAGSQVIALDEHGTLWNSADLAKRLQAWRQNARDVALIIGGADGLDKSVLSHAAEIWSLSKLTLPHMLVRVLVAEQLYRAWTIISKHPYHRS